MGSNRLVTTFVHDFILTNSAYLREGLHLFQSPLRNVGQFFPPTSVSVFEHTDFMIIRHSNHHISETGSMLTILVLARPLHNMHRGMPFSSPVSVLENLGQWLTHRRMKLRWPPFVGQFCGLDKLVSGLDFQAASWSLGSLMRGIPGSG